MTVTKLRRFTWVMFNVTRMVVPPHVCPCAKLSKVCLLSRRSIFTSVWLCEAVEKFFSRPLGDHAPRVRVVNSCRVCAKFNFRQKKINKKWLVPLYFLHPSPTPLHLHCGPVITGIRKTARCTHNICRTHIIHNNNNQQRLFTTIILFFFSVLVTGMEIRLYIIYKIYSDRHTPSLSRHWSEEITRTVKM